MARIAKILPIPKEYKEGVMTMENALASKGWNRMPGSGVAFPPLRSVTGKYLTGLDPEADYIRRMPDEKEQKAEQKIVRERLERLQKETGLDLGPRSAYYADVYGTKHNSGEVATRAKLIDGENVFNFSNPHKEIEFWWVVQNRRLIASSLESYKAGRESPEVQFYVSNPEAEADVVYKKNQNVMQAVKSLDAMSLEKRIKVAKLMGLPVTDKDKEQLVFNQLYNLINMGNIGFGEHKGRNSVELFNQIAALADDKLDAKTLIKEAIQYRVYSVRSGIIYEGDNVIANSEAELLADLLLPTKQSHMLALQVKVNDKKKMRNL